MQRPELIASDVDGTLLDPGESLTARTLATIRRVLAAGVPFVLVTGRPPRWIPPVSGPAGLTGYAVCANGAVLYDIGADRVLQVHGLDPVLLHDVAHALDPVLPGAMLAAERIEVGDQADPGDAPGLVTEHGYTNPWGDGENFPRSRAEILGHPAIKLLVRHPGMTSDEMAVAASSVLGDAVTVTFSTGRGLIELSAPGVTKATGLADAAARLEVSQARVVAFGDMPNDVPMLRWAGHGVAMSGGHSAAVAAADEVTAGNSEDGVAQVLERWF